MEAIILILIWGGFFALLIYLTIRTRGEIAKEISEKKYRKMERPVRTEISVMYDKDNR